MEVDTTVKEQLIGENKRSNKSAIIKELILYGVIFVLCVFIIPRYVVQKTIVDGESMELSLYDQDRLLIDKLTYQFQDPERFDIVVFYPYGKDVDEYYVKRVIGLPGETVQIVGEDIYINDVLLEEDYGKDPITYAGMAAESVLLGEDEFFLLGDNREVSFDSRYEEIGLVHKNMIAGHTLLRIWPLKDFGIVK